MPDLKNRPRPLRIALRALLAPARWVERARGRRRLALLLLYAVLLTPFALWGRRAARLQGLPDIGDPFDVKEFLASKAVPEDQDAMVFFRRAGERFRPLVDRTSGAGVRIVNPRRLNAVLQGGWGAADATIRGWLEENREALELWRKGAERPGASFHNGPPNSAVDDPVLYSHYFQYGKLVDFMDLAHLESLRVTEAGDAAEGWAMRRASLRCVFLMMRDGPSNRFDLTSFYFVRSIAGAANWAADPKVDTAALRRALEDLQAMESLWPVASDLYKWQYLNELEEVEEIARDRGERPYMIGAPGPGPLYRSEWDLITLNYGPTRELLWFLAAEPERSRRLLRLVYDNWLTQADQPADRRPARSTAPPWLYEDAPGRGRIAPDELAHRFMETALAPRVLGDSRFESRLEGNRTRLGILVVHIAEQAYLREHGKLPASAKELVGPYLKRLPESYDDFTGGAPPPKP